MQAGAELSGRSGGCTSFGRVNNELGEQNGTLQFILLIAGKVAELDVADDVLPVS